MSDSTAADSRHQSHPPHHQYSVRTVLLIMTMACVLLAITRAVVPDDESAWTKILMFLALAVPVAFGTWIIWRSQKRPWQLPENTITVQVDAKWLRRVKSPLIMLPIAALTGVSVTFAPLCLLWCGQIEKFGIVEWICVPVCFLVINLVPRFYMGIAGEVIAQLVKYEDPAVGSK